MVSDKYGGQAVQNRRLNFLHVGHIGNLPPRRHRARFKGCQIHRVSQKVADRIPRAVVHSPLDANCNGLEMTVSVCLQFVSQPRLRQ